MEDTCPDCRVDLDDDGFEVRCWKCGWTLRQQDDPHGYQRRHEAIEYREACR